MGAIIFQKYPHRYCDPCGRRQLGLFLTCLDYRLLLFLPDFLLCFSVPAIDYNPIQRSLFINKFTVPRQVIFVESDLDLLLRTTINKRGKTIEFRAVNNYNGFRGKIEASFPPFSVLGEEKVFLEIVPEPLVRAWNEASKKLNSRVPAIITPILHIDRENDFPFLRDVEISLPIFPRVLRENCKMLDNISVQNGRAHLRESKFSPKAVCYDEIQGILRALRIDTHFRLAFKKLGVYLLVEQFPQNKFLFDLRPFRDEEEHRLFRMDEKKTFRMIVNPQLVDDESVYLSEVSITIQGNYLFIFNHRLILYTQREC